MNKQAQNMPLQPTRMDISSTRGRQWAGGRGAAFAKEHYEKRI